jgi:hypothetical protein
MIGQQLADRALPTLGSNTGSQQVESTSGTKPPVKYLSFESLLARGIQMAERKPFRLLPWHAGILIGIAASLAQASYYLLPTAVQGIASYKVAPPAYGFCMFCHTRDLVNWFVQVVAPIIAPAPISVIAPTSTLIGVLLGALLSARMSKQFAWRTTIAPWKAFVTGMGVSFFAGMLGACPLRIIVRAGYLELFAFVGMGSIAFGVALGTYAFLKRGAG